MLAWNDAISELNAVADAGEVGVAPATVEVVLRDAGLLVSRVSFHAHLPSERRKGGGMLDRRIIDHFQPIYNPKNYR